MQCIRWDEVDGDVGQGDCDDGGDCDDDGDDSRCDYDLFFLSLIPCCSFLVSLFSPLAISCPLFACCVRSFLCYVLSFLSCCCFSVLLCFLFPSVILPPLSFFSYLLSSFLSSDVCFLFLVFSRVTFFRSCDPFSYLSLLAEQFLLCSLTPPNPLVLSLLSSPHKHTSSCRVVKWHR